MAGRAANGSGEDGSTDHPIPYANLKTRLDAKWQGQDDPGRITDQDGNEADPGVLTQLDPADQCGTHKQPKHAHKGPKERIDENEHTSLLAPPIGADTWKKLPAQNRNCSVFAIHALMVACFQQHGRIAAAHHRRGYEQQGYG